MAFKYITYQKANILIIVFAFIFVSCKKDNLTRGAKVETKAVSEILASTAKATGDIIDLGSGITDYGHCWGFIANPTIADSTTSLGSASKTGTYTSILQNLVPRKLYHIRAYVKSKTEILYGSDQSFTTLGPPILTTTAATDITGSSATIGGNITVDGGSAVTDRGVYWRASTNPDTTGTKLQIGSGTGLFSTSLTGLTPNTIYYFKAYANNATGTVYGVKLSFTTPTVPGVPTIGTATAGDAQATVTFTAPVSNGGSAIRGYTVTSSPGGFTGTGTTSPIIVAGLTNGTAYTFTVTATNANGTSVASAASNSVTPSTPTPVTDIDGNVYNVVTIGTQVWMAENLKTTKYNDGTIIPNVTDNTIWAALTTGTYSDYNNTLSNSTTYGRLYNWYVVDNNAATKVASNGGKNVCPTSWHVPTDVQWTTLTTYLGGEGVAGGKLKETGTTHWTTLNTGATNETGFTALPGGYRDYDGTYNDVEYGGTWWSSTEYFSNAWCRYIYSSSTFVGSNYGIMLYGFSVRCVRDY